MFLEHLVRRTRESFPSESPARVVITVPASFSHLQRSYTLQAAKSANIDVVHVLNEPMAAALGLRQHLALGNVMIYDLGAGMLDVSIIDANHEVIKVIATSGDAISTIGLSTFARGGSEPCLTRPRCSS
jgi:molecular chaperone DnaK